MIHGTFAPKVATRGFVGDFDAQCQQDGTCLGPGSLQGSTSPASTFEFLVFRATFEAGAWCGASQSTATPATSSARRLIPRRIREPPSGGSPSLCALRHMTVAGPSAWVYSVGLLLRSLSRAGVGFFGDSESSRSSILVTIGSTTTRGRGSRPDFRPTASVQEVLPSHLLRTEQAQGGL